MIDALNEIRWNTQKEEIEKTLKKIRDIRNRNIFYRWFHKRELEQLKALVLIQIDYLRSFQ